MAFSERHSKDPLKQPLSTATVQRARNATAWEYSKWETSGNALKIYADYLDKSALATQDGMHEEARVIVEESQKFAPLLDAYDAEQGGGCPITFIAKPEFSEEEKAFGFMPLVPGQKHTAIMNNLDTLERLAFPEEAALEQTEPLIKARGCMQRMAVLLHQLDADAPTESLGNSTQTALMRGKSNRVLLGQLKTEVERFDRLVLGQSNMAYRMLEEISPEQMAALEKKYADRPMTQQEAFQYRDNFVREFKTRMEDVSRFVKRELIKPELNKQQIPDR